MTTKAMQEQIIDKHMAALLLDLKRHGIDALGVAGGVVLAVPERSSWLLRCLPGWSCGPWRSLLPIDPQPGSRSTRSTEKERELMVSLPR